MSDAPYRVSPLDVALHRTQFHSGNELLDRYFRETVSQDIRRRVAACFVATSSDGSIAGYYTLASASVLLDKLPASIAKKLPRYPTLPAVRLGRLAVDKTHRGKGLGGALLADALERAIRAEIAAYALLVDAKDDAAAAFYKHHGFIALPESPLTQFLPLATYRSLAQS
ncbi:GNAT family N-acetyltransferase [Cupriavidus necator]|uniref:GNAT family N-acetyltransferase n=1 Tax=Cupriavidus necator TaxID=106590 RepID=UPI0039C35793